MGFQYTFFWSGCPEGTPRIRGVGFAIRTNIANRLTEAPTAISERLMTLPLAKGRYATLISAYAPTFTSDDQSKEEFYYTLSNTISRVPNTDELLLLGDFNARVGTNADFWQGVIGPHSVGNMNDNGLRLLSLCTEYNLSITNTFFKMKNKHKTTWIQGQVLFGFSQLSVWKYEQGLFP